MKKIITVLPLVLVLFSAAAMAKPATGFKNIKCGTNIAKALMGRYMPNETVSVTEAKYKDLGLQDLGGTEISNTIFSISWMICGDEYLLLEKRDIVRDVLRVPEHSKSSPENIAGECQVNRVKRKDAIVAILDGSATTPYLPAKSAWRIDEAKVRFVPMSTSGLSCSRASIITADGGQ